MKIGCVEEAAWRAGFIDDTRLRELAGPLTRSGYGDYLLRLLEWEALPGVPVAADVVAGAAVADGAGGRSR